MSSPCIRRMCLANYRAGCRVPFHSMPFLLHMFINLFNFDEFCNNTNLCISLKCCKTCNVVVEISVMYCAVSGDDGQHEFHT